MNLVKEKGVYLLFKGLDFELGVYFEICKYISEVWSELCNEV